MLVPGPNFVNILSRVYNFSKLTYAMKFFFPLFFVFVRHGLTVAQAVQEFIM